MAIKTTFARREMKYLITEEQQSRLMAAIGHRLHPDKWGKSIVCSLYYDTPTFLLIRRSLEHPIYKEKFRLRCYGELTENSRVFAEIKKKHKSIVYKRRTVLNAEETADFLQNGPPPGNTQIAKEIAFFFSRYELLEPKMLIQCAREAYFSKEDAGLRITFDRDILYRTDALFLSAKEGGTPLLGPSQILMEIKAEGAVPLWLCHILSHEKLYKTSFSKYGGAYQQTQLITQEIGDDSYYGTTVSRYL